MDYYGNTMPDDTVINLTPHNKFVFVGADKKVSEVSIVGKAVSGSTKIYTETTVILNEADYFINDDTNLSHTILQDIMNEALADGFATQIATALNNAIGGE